MNKSEKQMQQDLAEVLITRAALRALFFSHPNPAALRDAWHHAMSMAWADFVTSGMENPTGMLETFQRYQEVMESYLPDAPNSPDAGAD